MGANFSWAYGPSNSSCFMGTTIKRISAPRRMPVALATCSTQEHIDAVMEKHGIRELFDLLVSAAVKMPGKPHPEVYLRTAALLKTDPTRCLAFEDSFAGVIAAKAARMRVVAMPDPSEYDQERFGAADIKIRSLNDFTIEMFNKLQEA